MNEAPPSSSPPLEPRHPAVRGTLQAMSGTTQSAASAREHVRRFWSTSGIDLLEAPLSPAEQVLHGSLQSWFASSGERALLQGADARARTKVAARLAVEVAHRRQAKVVFVPVSRALGTAVERDMLELFFALFDTSRSAVFSRPRTPRELMSSIALGLQGVGWVSALPDEEAPRLLVILDGIERAADGWPRASAPFLAEIGEGASVLVTATATAAGARSWLARLAWPSEGTTELDLAGALAPVAEGTSRASRAGGAAPESAAPADRRLRHALAAALAPVSERDLVEAMGLGAGEVGAAGPMGAATPPAIGRSEDGRWLWQEDDAAGVTATDGEVVAFEQAVVAGGARVLADAAHPPWCAYGVEYLGAHMVRQGCGAEALLALVSPDWLAQWTTRPRALLGFLADVNRARDACELRLLDACRGRDGGGGSGDGEGARAAMIGGVVRCALVEHALLAKEGSREADHDRQAPYAPAPLVLERATGCARERAEALASLAALMPGADGDAVRASARQASGDGGEVAAQPMPVVLTDPRETDAQRGAKLRAGTTHDELDGWLSHDRRIRPSGLAPEEAWALAQSRHDEARMVAFAGILPDLPESLRAAAVREVMTEYWKTAGHEALRIAVACAPWMALEDAARVLVMGLGGSWSEPRSVFVGYGGLAELAPLLQRLAGHAALMEAARAIVAVGAWLP
ncbi:MAG: hypothetical protein WKG00_21810 [Polyangiaceae bacterium]